MNCVYFILLLQLLNFLLNPCFFMCVILMSSRLYGFGQLRRVQNMMRGEGLESENVNNLENPSHTFLPSGSFLVQVSFRIRPGG